MPSISQTKYLVLFGILGLALAVGVFMPSHGARADVGFVQSAAGSSGVTTVAIPFTSNNTGGNLIVVGVTILTTQTASVSDTQGNTYQVAVGPTDGGGSLRAYVFYAKNIRGGANTVTVTRSSSANFIVAAIHEYSGIAIASPLDRIAGAANASTNTFSSGATATTTQAAELLFGWGTADGITTWSAGGLYTLRSTASAGGIESAASEDQIVSAVGSYTATASLSLAENGPMQIAAFKLALQGVQVSSRSDTLSNSQPSATSNHTFAFTVNNAIYGSSVSNSSTLALTLDSAFTIPANLDCGDIDVATGSQFNFNWPACQQTSTAWGLSVTGSILTLIPPTDTAVHVATGTPVTIKIGSNATVGQQGAHWITNPASAGIYTISVGGSFGGSGNMLVSINSGVTVQATVAESLAFTASSVNAVNCTADDSATVNTVTSTATSVPFGIISPNTFYQGCQDLIVSTNAGNGYSLTVQESSAMKTANGQFTIPDTTCDAGGCTESAAAAWATATHNGFGHTCANQLNHDCNAAYSSGTNFRQAADLSQGETAQSVMSSSTAATATGRMKYRLSAGAGQAAGIYTTIITYIITGTY